MTGAPVTWAEARDRPEGGGREGPKQPEERPARERLSLSAGLGAGRTRGDPAPRHPAPPGTESQGEGRAKTHLA